MLAACRVLRQQTFLAKRCIGWRSLASLSMQVPAQGDPQPVHWTEDPRAGTDASPIPLTPNQHWTVDQETGQRVVDFDFVEEPLGMPVDSGFGGFPQFEFGDVLGAGADNPYRYSILRKLGWGMNSSTWLVQEQSNHQYFALKALTGRCTEFATKGLHWELEMLQRLAPARNAHCLQLLDQFIVPGRGSAGRHLCLVTQLLGGDVKNYFRGQKLPRVPIHISKRILLHTLRALANLHEYGVIHTDLKSDNIFFDIGELSNDDISRLLSSDPSRRHEAEASYDGVVHAAVSQPLPLPPLEEVATRTYVLGDLGSAQYIHKRVSEVITPESLRAPEIYIGGPWNEKADIWSFGCLVYELVTGVPLFKHEAGDVKGISLDATEAILLQMIAHSWDKFEPPQLSVSKQAGQHFNEWCVMKKEPGNYHYPSELWVLRNTDGEVSEGEALEVVRFMRRCLRLDPAHRPSARELLDDEWFRDAA